MAELNVTEGALVAGLAEQQQARARVLLLINSLGGGGAERSLAELLPYIRDADIDPVILCLKRREEGLEGDVLGGAFELRYLPGKGIMAWTRQLRRILRSERFNLIHTAIFESDIVGRLAAAGSGLPVLTSLVNTSYESVRLSDPNVSRSGLSLARMLDGWTARNFSDHFHAITHAVKEASIRALGIKPDRVTVIERGRDQSRLGLPSLARRRRARESLGLDHGDVVVVSVGRQEYQKGQSSLLRAFSQVARKWPAATLLLVGRKGHASIELEEIHQRLNLAGKVRFLGYRDDVPEILAAADLFAFPSVYEGQGGALIEAMALGLPVVATDIPSTREVVEEGANALLVPVQCDQSLALAIDILLSEPRRLSAFGQRSAEIFQARFTLDRSARRMVDLYHTLIER